MDFPRGDLMFRPVMTKTGKPVEFQFEDEIITAIDGDNVAAALLKACLLYTSPSPRDATLSRMPSSA